MSGSRLKLFVLGFSCWDILVFIRILDSCVLYVHGFGDKREGSIAFVSCYLLWLDRILNTRTQK